jgi:hypothetical protein
MTWRRTRAVPVPVLVGLVLASGVQPAAGQSRPATAGAFGGYVHNEHRWSREVDTEAVGGLVLGAWVDAPTGLGWLSVTAEGAYAQRGGDARFDDAVVPGAFGVSPIRTDALTFSVLPRATLFLGPVALHAATGPTLDYILRSRLDPVLEPLLEEVTTGFAWTLSAGIRGMVGEGYVAELEARIVEGLRDAFRGQGLSLRNRSLEVVARVGTALRRD